MVYTSLASQGLSPCVPRKLVVSKPLGDLSQKTSSRSPAQEPKINPGGGGVLGGGEACADRDTQHLGSTSHSTDNEPSNCRQVTSLTRPHSFPQGTELYRLPLIFFPRSKMICPKISKTFSQPASSQKYSPINTLKISSFKFNTSSWQACVPSGNPRKSFISFPLYGSYLYSLAYGTFLHLQACNVASSDLSLSITLVSTVTFWTSCFHLVSTFVITSIN